MHTPGPWIITHNHAWDKDLDVRLKNGKQVAFVGSLNEDDAKLIAAAPDLLAALKVILDNDGGEGSKCYDASALFKAREQAKQAIAKALGEEI